MGRWLIITSTCIVLAALKVQARDLYVSPDATPPGAGTLGQPHDLATALQGPVGRPGDTFWLRGGNYSLGHVHTRIAGAPGEPITFRVIPGERARVDGSINFFDSVGYVILRDFELFSSDTNRASSQTGVGFDVTDISIIPGIASFAPNLSFINLVVHDQTRHGFYLSQISSNNLVYGCVIYNNGWVSPDNAEGHGIYAQGALGKQEFADNLVFQSSGANLHVYESGEGQRLMGLTLDGNVAFLAGGIQMVRPYRDWIVGVDAPAISVDGIVLKNNMSHYAAMQVEIGREGINGSVALLNNYFPQGLLLNNWTTAAVAGNLFAAAPGNPVVALDQTGVSLAAVWDNNAYVHTVAGGNFAINTNAYSFPEWQSATGYDQNSTYRTGTLSGTSVFVRPNRYEPGRAHIVVYNWDSLSHVTVDVSSVLAPGAAYELRNAQDFFAPPVLSGVFDPAHPELELPMTGLSVAAPTGPLLTPAPTGPMFNCFVLMPRLVRLQIEAVGGQAQISWTTNSGNWVLQFKETGDEDWTDDDSTPAVAGDRYVVTNSFSGSARVYRLRAAQ
jgi:hypothetical protein